MSVEFNDVDVSFFKRDAFEIHGLMFSIDEVIQCAFVSSTILYQAVYENPNCNAFLISIAKEGWISITTVFYSTEFYKRIKMKDENDDRLVSHASNVNKYIDGEDFCTVLLTKGFVIDNFDIQDSYHEFAITEEKETVLIRATDFEKLTDPDPIVQ